MRRGSVRLLVVVDEQVPPVRGLGVDVGDVEHHAPGQELVGERAGLHHGAGLGDHEVEDELPVRLVGRGQGHRVDVEGEQEGPGRQQEHGPEQAQRAHPHRAEGHDLAVAGEPPEGEEHAQQEGHGHGDGEDARQEVQEDAEDRADVGAPRHEDGE